MKIDDSTVEITLAAPNARFLYSITDMANVILPEHILSSVTKADVETVDFTVGTPGVTIGTGPYKLTGFTADQSVELEAYPRILQGCARRSASIIFKLFADPALAVAQLESGDLDLAFRVSPGEFDRLSAIDTLNVISAAEPRDHPDRVQDRGRRRGATSGSARRSTPRSTARRSWTTSTRVGRTC